MRRTMTLILGLIILSCPIGARSTRPIEIYGVWHCGSDLCGWDHVRDLAEFDRENHWLLDRGDGIPSVNLVVLSFVNPLRLLNLSSDAQTSEGIPAGMSPEIIRYFSDKKIRVMLSIGGFTYTRDWDQALAQGAVQLGRQAARAAQRLGVGIEIDYENDRNPNLAGLEDFIGSYRALLPYDPTGRQPAARLTIDLAFDDGYLAPLTQYATAKWLTVSHPVLDYANAMVPFDGADASAVESGWLEHIDGKAAVPPLAPAKLTGSLFIVNRRSLTSECSDFGASLEKGTGSFIETVAPHGAGKTSGMLGYMFWAAECPGSRVACASAACTAVSMGAKAYRIRVPMPPLRRN